MRDCADDDLCAVCLDRGADFYLSCGHRFHEGCAARWLAVKLSCPTCRRDLRAVVLRVALELALFVLLLLFVWRPLVRRAVLLLAF